MVGLISARRVKAARISQSHARDLPCLAGDRGLGRRCYRRHIHQTGHLPAAALIAGLSASVWMSMATSQAGGQL